MLDHHLAKVRLQQLTDVIFAMSLILMMSNIEVPKFGGSDDIDKLSDILLANVSDIGIYLITFIIIAILWVKNVEMFSVVKQMNKVFIWLQLISLSFIMLLPITNLFVTVDDKNQLVLIIYSLNLLVIGLTTWLSWRNIYQVTLTDDNVDDNLKKQVLARYNEAITEPVVAAISIPAAIISVLYWELTFTLVPIAFVLRKKFLSR